MFFGLFSLCSGEPEISLVRTSGDLVDVAYVKVDPAADGLTGRDLLQAVHTLLLQFGGQAHKVRLNERKRMK